MPTKKPATAKSVSKTQKEIRPQFSAPTPPEKNQEVVTNEPDAAELTENEDVYVEEIPGDTVENTNEPTGRTIKRNKLLDENSPLDQMLNEDAGEDEVPDETAEAPEDAVPADQPKAKPIETPKKKTPTPPPVNSNSKTGSTNVLLVGLIVLLIIFAGAGWGMYLNTVQPNLLPQLPSLTAPTPTPEPTTTPAPTPTPAAPITLEILNGAGVAGAASDTQVTLEELGYQIDSIGNADNSNYPITEIFTHPNFTRLSKLEADLEEAYGLSTVSGELEEDATIDARIILGKNWFQE
jgi:hypothetical protein